MAQMQNQQTIALQLEKVRDKVPLLYERDDVLLSMIQRARDDVEKVSSRNMRIPLQTSAYQAARRGRITCGWRGPGPRLGDQLRRGTSFADLLPVRGGDPAKACGLRHERAREGH